MAQGSSSKAKTTSKKDDGGADSELRKRRERLEALKAKRPAPEPSAANDTEPAAARVAKTGTVGPGGGRRAAGGGRLFGGAQGAGGGPAGAAGPARERQRELLRKVHKILTQTPEDAGGRVPDTPFSEAGVARLMDILRARSGDAKKPGARAAQMLLNFVTAAEGEESTRSGASVTKLQSVARRMQAFRGKAGGAGRRGGF